MNAWDRMIELTDAINALPDDGGYARVHAEGFRRGWVDALESQGFSGGNLLMHADRVMMDRGVEGPMCGGVLLDESERSATYPTREAHLEGTDGFLCQHLCVPGDGKECEDPDCGRPTCA